MGREEVVAALEAATGPDREIDAAIVAIVTPGVVATDDSGELSSDWTNRLYLYEPARCWSDSWLPVPQFTASLDAALTLVPAACDCRYFTQDPSGMGWQLGAFNGDEVTVWSDGFSSVSPAIALCIAALRARTTLRAEAADHGR